MRVEGAPYPLGAPPASWAPRALSGLRFLPRYVFWSVKIHYIISRRFWLLYHAIIFCSCFELFSMRVVKARHHVVPLQQRWQWCLANEDRAEEGRTHGDQQGWRDQEGHGGPSSGNRRHPSTWSQSSYPNWDRSLQDDWVSSYTKQVSHTWKYFVEGAYHHTQGHYPQVRRPPTLDVRLSIITTIFFTNKRDIITWVWALPLATAKLGGGAPVSYHHHTPIFTVLLSSILLVISRSSRIKFWFEVVLSFALWSLYVTESVSYIIKISVESRALLFVVVMGKKRKNKKK